MKNYNKWAVLFGGWFGLHKYLNHQIGMGILYTLTFGLFGIGWLIDIFKIFVKDKNVPKIPSYILTGISGLFIVISISDYMSTKDDADIYIFVFFLIILLFSIKSIWKNSSNKEEGETEAKAFLEFQEALNDMGKSFADFFKDVYYVHVDFLSADTTKNDYLFTYKAKTKSQLNYLLSNQKEMFEKLDGKPTFNILFDTTFQMRINNTSDRNNNVFDQTVNSNSVYENQTAERIKMYNNEFDYMEGHDFEYFCADLLMKNEFQNVEVTKGSGDHGIDILAEKDGITYAIQCKCYSSNIGNAAVQQAHTGKSIYHKDIAVVITNRYFTQQAIEEAAALGVKLWDRDKLNELIKKSNKNE